MRGLNLLGAALGLACLAGLGWAAIGTGLSDFDQLRAYAATENPTRHVWLQRAEHWRPDLAANWRLDTSTVSDPAEARSLALHAVQLNPHNWQNWSALALLDLQIGDARAAASDLAHATQVDRGFDGHFQLANVSWVLGDQPHFLKEMRLALPMTPADRLISVLDELIRLDASQPGLLTTLAPALPSNLQARAVVYLSSRTKLDAATALWNQLQCSSIAPECAAAAQHLCAAWLGLAPRTTPLSAPAAAGSSAEAASVALAVRIWDDAIARHALQAAPARFGSLADSEFRFDWRGVFAWNGEDPRLRLQADPSLNRSIASLSLDGSETGDIAFLSQWVPVRPGQHLLLEVRSRGTSAIAAQGLAAMLRTRDGGLLLKLPLALNLDWRTARILFAAPSSDSLLRLSIEYSRPSGVPTLQDTVEIASIALRPVQDYALPQPH